MVALRVARRPRLPVLLPAVDVGQPRRGTSDGVEVPLLPHPAGGGRGGRAVGLAPEAPQEVQLVQGEEALLLKIQRAEEDLHVAGEAVDGVRQEGLEVLGVHLAPLLPVHALREGAVQAAEAAVADPAELQQGIVRRQVPLVQGDEAGAVAVQGAPEPALVLEAHAAGRLAEGVEGHAPVGLRVQEEAPGAGEAEVLAQAGRLERQRVLQALRVARRLRAVASCTLYVLEAYVLCIMYSYSI